MLYKLLPLPLLLFLLILLLTLPPIGESWTFYFLCLLHGRQHSRCLSNICSFNGHNNLLRLMVILTPLYILGIWATGTLRSFPQVAMQGQHLNPHSLASEPVCLIAPLYHLSYMEKIYPERIWVNLTIWKRQYFLLIHNTTLFWYCWRYW